jgi:regulator of protease activity HflC (stomatin/prohibitin superfamily)
MAAKFKRRVWESAPAIVISILFVVFMFAFLSPRIFITIPAGYEGVLYRRVFGGTDVDRVYKEGLRLFLPWDTVTLYNLREQVLTLDLNALLEDGLSVGVTVTVRFQPKSRLLGTLHKEHGPDYIKTFLTPELESVARHVLGGSKPVELYSTGRNQIEKDINRQLDGELRQFDEFEDRHWPNIPLEMLFQGKVAVSSDNNPNVRLILKELYSFHEDEHNDLYEIIRKTGFVHVFGELIEREHNYEQARGYLKQNEAQLIEKIERAKRDLEMGITRGKSGAQHAKRSRAILDSLKAVYHELKATSDELAEKFVEGNKQFQVLRRPYDLFFKTIELKDVLISSVVLPEKIKNAIESKLHQEQVAQEFVFRLEREIKEAERKRIEAKGIKDFQEMVAAGIEEGLLKWKAIEATLELAKSQNAKMIVIGAGEDGLPIILGNQGWDFPKTTLIDSVNRVEPSITSVASDSMSQR